MSRATTCLLDTDYSKVSSEPLERSSNKRHTRGIGHILRLWRERSKQRRQLLELADDSDLLKDLGLSNYDLWHEGRKPFWRS